MHDPKDIELLGEDSRKRRHQRSDQTAFGFLLARHDPSLFKTRLPSDRAQVGLCLIVVIELVECFTEAIRELDPVVNYGEEHFGLIVFEGVAAA